jgi:phytoene dehydrogenase-like protein
MIEWLGIQGDDNLGEIARYKNDVASLSPQEIDALDDVTFSDFLSRYRLPKPYCAFVAAQTMAGLVVPIDRMAASEAIKIFQGMSAGKPYYNKGGYGRLLERCVEAMKRDGGEVIYQAKVERIVVEGGQLKGVITDKGAYNAPVVISNAGVQPTVLKLVGEEHFDKSYIKYVKNLVPSLGMMGVRYFLDSTLIECDTCVVFSDEAYWDTQRSLRAKEGKVPEELSIFITIPSNFDPNLSPTGQQCILASILCPADPNMNNNQAYWDKLDETMERIWPGFMKHVSFKELYSTKHVSSLARDQVLPEIGGECIGLGQVVGQCGRHKPSAQAPISGLYYVGCDAGGSGCGVIQAIDSAFHVARLVQKQ